MTGVGFEEYKISRPPVIDRGLNVHLIQLPQPAVGVERRRRQFFRQPDRVLFRHVRPGRAVATEDRQALGRLAPPVGPERLVGPEVPEALSVPEVLRARRRRGFRCMRRPRW